MIDLGPVLQNRAWQPSSTCLQLHGLLPRQFIMWAVYQRSRHIQASFSMLTKLKNAISMTAANTLAVRLGFEPWWDNPQGIFDRRTAGDQARGSDDVG